MFEGLPTGRLYESLFSPWEHQLLVTWVRWVSVKEEKNPRMCHRRTETKSGQAKSKYCVRETLSALSNQPPAVILPSFDGNDVLPLNLSPREEEMIKSFREFFLKS